MTRSQSPPPFDPMDDLPATHRVVDVPNESTLQLPAAAAAAGGEIRDFNRRCKMATAFIFVLLTISASLIATIPPVYPDWVVLHSIDPALAFTSLIASLGLLFYSLSSHPGAELAQVQLIVLSFSAALLVLACLFRLTLHFPFWLVLSSVLPSMAVFPLLNCGSHSGPQNQSDMTKESVR